MKTRAPGMIILPRRIKRRRSEVLRYSSPEFRQIVA
jgi:hypothetical protein